MTQVTIIVVGAGAMSVDESARLGHASPPAQVPRTPRTTQNIAWLEPWVPRAEIMKNPLEGY